MSLDDIYDAVLDFDEDGISQLINQELESGTDAKTILNEALIEALDEVGKCFTEGTMFVPDMLMAAETMKVGVDVLRPLLTGDNSTNKGTAVIGSVKGDMHDIGKNLVGMMVEGAGFTVIDLGVDVDTETFLNATREHKAKFVLMSALLTTTMLAMKEAVQTIKAAEPDLKIVVGGAPVNREFANTIGADGYSDDAPGAVAVMRAFVS
ncbi:MAG TPA: corrinoid protein [Nitrospinaceae bacterium]|nr:corrinoid protein [Nitrospinaceae bacterium]